LLRSFFACTKWLFHINSQNPKNTELNYFNGCDINLLADNIEDCSLVHLTSVIDMTTMGLGQHFNPIDLLAMLGEVFGVYTMDDT
jgi:hypothetical protein